MATTTSHNKKSSAVKRILSEARELEADASREYEARPLEDNIFEWHFTLRGPSGSEFENGIYHGRIILPAEYPFRPPSLMLLTPNGRWECNKKICLTFTGFHEEMWQPAWGIRTALLGVQGFMSAKAEAATGVGSLDYPEEERRKLADKSQDWYCTDCAKTNLQLLPELDPSQERKSEQLPQGLQVDTNRSPDGDSEGADAAQTGEGSICVKPTSRSRPEASSALSEPSSTSTAAAVQPQPPISVTAPDADLPVPVGSSASQADSALRQRNQSPLSQSSSSSAAAAAATPVTSAPASSSALAQPRVPSPPFSSQLQPPPPPQPRSPLQPAQASPANHLLQARHQQQQHHQQYTYGQALPRPSTPVPPQLQQAQTQHRPPVAAAPAPAAEAAPPPPRQPTRSEARVAQLDRAILTVVLLLCGLVIRRCL